jgi:hypothetical protein
MTSAGRQLAQEHKTVARHAVLRCPPVYMAPIQSLSNCRAITMRWIWLVPS